MKASDPINPSHYRMGDVECIDAIKSAIVGKSAVEGYLVGNVLKYLWRFEAKGGAEDVRKAQWYLNKLLEKLSEQDNSPKSLTHTDGCWSWGQAHYDCACAEVAKLKGWSNGR